MSQVPSLPGARAIPLAYGAVHAVVDATTVSVIFGAVGVHDVSPEQSFSLIVTYDVLAFASQALFGLVADRLRAPRAFAIIGVLLATASLVCMPFHALAAVLLAGTGNALFHVGGGALALSVEPGRAAAPGLFVGPGALGLALGLFFGTHGFSEWPFYLALAASLGVLIGLPVPRPAYGRLPVAAPRVPQAALVVGLLLLSVVIRSFVGLAGCHACPKSVELSFSLATAAFAGKFVGGLLSDRLGWARTCTAALLCSAPILAFASAYPAAMVAGMFLFQLTMPATLAALMGVFPRRPGFVFGIACVALIAGALPTFSLSAAALYSDLGFFGLIVASAGALFLGLRLVERARPWGAPPAPRVEESASATLTANSG